MNQLIDPIADQIPREIQIHAARLAQDAFSHAFRQTLEAPAVERKKLMADAAKKLNAWLVEAGDAKSALRLGLLLSGLDQWGLAYSQVFGATAMAGLSELLSCLRALQEDGGFAGSDAVERFEASEACAFSFKADLRKDIHLALWHSMIAEEEYESATNTLTQLGGMMLGLLKSMPTLGWIIVANTLAEIQIRCLAHGLAASGPGQEMTQQLFGALKQQLPADQQEKIMAGATRTVIAWQQSAREATTH